MGTGAARWRLGLAHPGRLHAGQHSCARHRQIVWRPVRGVSRGFRCIASGGRLDSGALLFSVQLFGASVEHTVGQVFVSDRNADRRYFCGRRNDGVVLGFVRHVFVHQVSQCIKLVRTAMNVAGKLLG